MWKFRIVKVICLCQPIENCIFGYVLPKIKDNCLSNLGGSMPNLSLTDLIDVVSKSGTPKATKVRQIKNRPAYQPAIDFYKPLRDTFVKIHTEGADRSSLDGIVPERHPPGKIAESRQRWRGR